MDEIYTEKQEAVQEEPLPTEAQPETTQNVTAPAQEISSLTEAKHSLLYLLQSVAHYVVEGARNEYTKHLKVIEKHLSLKQ
jgi:hypothetical protein